MVSDKEQEKVIRYLTFAINADNMCESDIEEAEALLGTYQTQVQPND